MKIMIIYKADKTIEKRFHSLLSRYQIGLEIWVKGSFCLWFCSFIILQTSQNKAESRWWIKYRLFQLDKKQRKINPTNENDNKCFHFAEEVAKIKKNRKHSEKKSKIKTFIGKVVMQFVYLKICNFQGINYGSKTGDWKKFEKNTLAIALNV